MVNPPGTAAGAAALNYSAGNIPPNMNMDDNEPSK